MTLPILRNYLLNFYIQSRNMNLFGFFNDIFYIIIIVLYVQNFSRKNDELIENHHGVT